MAYPVKLSDQCKQRLITLATNFPEFLAVCLEISPENTEWLADKTAEAHQYADDRHSQESVDYFRNVADADDLLHFDRDCDAIRRELEAAFKAERASRAPVAQAAE